MFYIEQSCGTDIQRSGYEVGEFADSHSSGEGQMNEVLGEFYNDAVNRPQGKCADKNRNLREIELEERRHQRQRYLKKHKNL